MWFIIYLVNWIYFNFIFISKYLVQYKLTFIVYVQSNQKMHDLNATKHTSEMALPDAFWAV